MACHGHGWNRAPLTGTGDQQEQRPPEAEARRLPLVMIALLSLTVVLATARMLP